jgi:hypothetical protein
MQSARWLRSQCGRTSQPPQAGSLGQAKAVTAQGKSFGSDHTLKTPQQKPDAGASAGDKSRFSRSVARPCAPGLDIGRQACPGKRRKQLAAKSAMNGRPRVGESGVGSNAGPICLCRPDPLSFRRRLLLQTCESPQLRSAAQALLPRRFPANPPSFRRISATPRRRVAALRR